MKEFTLYSYFRSSSAWRVRIALGLKGIDYEYRPVHLLNNGGEQLNENYAKLNPSREVPTLIHNINGKETVLHQSVAILEYLDSVQPTPRLFPQEPTQKAHVLAACEVVNSAIQPLQNLRVLKFLTEELKISDQQKSEWLTHWHIRGLKTLEAIFEKSAGHFCFGDEPSAADCFLVPNLFSAKRFQVDISPYKTLLRIEKSCEKREAFIRATPEQSPDFPKSP